MSNKIEKPKRSSSELVSILRDEKGITFNYINEETAAEYLTNRNNYLRTASYRKNYDKHRDGPNEGKYINLDFAYLVEISKIDMYLRSHLLPMCIDVEHALKVKIISDIEENPNEDGYSVVDEFLDQNLYILNQIAKKSRSVFTGDLISKYFSIIPNPDIYHLEIVNIDCPAWVLVEVLTFKDTISFLKFYQEKYPDRITLNLSLLNTVRNLRNACAHNNCILYSLRPRSTVPSPKVSSRVSKIKSITKGERTTKLSCRPIFEITCLLMVYEELVSNQVREHRMKEFKQFVHSRLIKNKEYFNKNKTISTSITFLQNLIDNFN